MSRRSHVLRGRLPQGSRFVALVPELLEALPQRIEVDGATLDRSLESLHALDHVAAREGRRRCLEPAIFAPLTAYLGEVLRRAKGGIWMLHYVSEFDVWEPWIVDGEGAHHAPFLVLARALDGPAVISIADSAAASLKIRHAVT